MADVRTDNYGCYPYGGNEWIWIIVIIAIFFCFCGGFNFFGPCER
ncbi:hypothetical protein [Petroclostridium sp. X23]|nr:hypothetical protein [Petroclostridium sp. X23]WHH61556.1 hypothetical protein QKW49_13010 [Petroclostridium sp. X23]